VGAFADDFGCYVEVREGGVADEDGVGDTY